MRTCDRYSFSLDRPGVRYGYRVRRRLRVVDTATIVVELAAGFASIGLWIWSLGRIKQVVHVNHPAAILAIALAGFLFVIYTVDAAVLWLLRCLFRLSGLMSREEAQSYPLRWGKRCIDPWPATWQEREDLRVKE